ncbi:hypothetical protein [Actinoplanes sp. NPDC026619]|uniref:hypothetical protein n=1 Tax=Actinoplanes sp. NPDC026619 TaxID=3155798 RepID=UPI0033C852B4
MQEAAGIAGHAGRIDLADAYLARVSDPPARAVAQTDLVIALSPNGDEADIAQLIKAAESVLDEIVVPTMYISIIARIIKAWAANSNQARAMAFANIAESMILDLDIRWPTLSATDLPRRELGLALGRIGEFAAAHRVIDGIHSDSWAAGCPGTGPEDRG